MKRICISSFFLVCSLIGLHAQPTCYFEHYSTEDGLPQYVVTDMLQDSKGFMWFATWDGFARFDGHTFRNFKVQSGDSYQMKSSRIEHIYEDRYGFIWLETYDDEAHRFDPTTETFIGLRSIKEYQQHNLRLSKLYLSPTGKTWMIFEENGVICISDSLFNTQVYSNENLTIMGDKVFEVIEDKDLNSWLLTDNGLYRIAAGQTKATPFFYGNNQKNDNQAFFSFVEMEKEIWFGSGKGKIWIYNKKSKKFKLLETVAASNITGFQLINQNEIIITTANDGFIVCNMKEHSSKVYNTKTNTELMGNSIRGLFFDSRNQFWFQTKELGIYKFDTKTTNIKYYYFNTEDVGATVFPSGAKLTEDIYGQIWVHPRGGGFSLYNPQTDKLEPFYNEESSADWKFSNILHSLFSDKQGNLWFCTRSHGLEKVSFKNNNFKTSIISQNTRSPIANDVRSVLQDKYNRIWIATKEGRIAIYDQNLKYIGDFSTDGFIKPNTKFAAMVYSMLEDDQGNIWLGTKTEGLFKVEKTNNPLKYKIEQFKNDVMDIYSLSEDVVYSIFQDSKKRIWVGTYGGGLNLLTKLHDGKTIFINHRNNLNSYPFNTGYRIRTISENKHGNICVGTTTGLVMFSSKFKTYDEIEFKHYARVPGESTSLGNNDIHSICNTRSGEMYLATFGGGLNKVIESDKDGFPLRFKSYTMKDGMPTDVCLAILEDKKGNLWVSTENNLTKFNIPQESFKTYAEIKRLMTNSNFSEASACKLKNNELIFGLSNGILHFSPDMIQSSKFTPYIAFTEFRLHNQIVHVGNDKSPLTKQIDDINNLILKRKQNSFSITYAALDYTLTNSILYAYMLEGFDHEWRFVQKQKNANYTNIPKGKYLFRVKSTNSDGSWMGNERVLKIEILPSFWETPLAMLLYLLVIIGIFLLSLRILFNFYRLKKDVEIEKHMSELKMKFFTDISHEIRTPLTMISGPVDYLLADKEIPESANFHLKLISQNAKRMLRLVNQILDLRKAQKTNLKIRETDLGVFTEKIFLTFIDVAKKHNIDYNFKNEAVGKKVWVDHNAMETILINLISNAFKYTPDNKSITVIINDNDKSLTFEVSDTGKGISKDKQKQLFTRFVSFNDDKSKPSTGIGLSLVKDLVLKHGGKIVVDSEVGHGSTFKVSLLTGLNHFNDDVEIIDEEIITVQDIIQESDDYQVKNTDPVPTEQKHKKVILLVEDDQELRAFTRSILEDDYTIIEAVNGKIGLEIAIEKNPDFIVSDIMMPEMDGIELLQKLKEDMSTSHIPVVLLTAKSAIESKLDGLNYGADDYITKPFCVTYFRARINNLLEQRKRLHEVYQTQLDSSTFMKFKPQSFVITNKDEMFMKKTIDLIEENIENTDFTIDELALAQHISRSVFFNKIKSLTGCSPSEFIREIKLQRAAQLIVSGEYMIKEISYMIGISDVKHFREIFKLKYGLSPTEYQAKLKDTKE